VLKAVLQSQLVVSWVAVVSFGLVWFGLGFFVFFFVCGWMCVWWVSRGRKEVAGFSLLFLRLWMERKYLCKSSYVSGGLCA
jgi:hypothetical protein